MKIACFQNLPACGAKRALYNFALEIHKKGHSLDFYSFDSFLDKHMNVADFADHIFSYPLGNFKRSFNVRPYFLRILWNFLKKFQYFIYLNQQYKKIAQDIDAKGYDLVFVHNCYYTQAPFLLRHLKTTSIYYAHEPIRSIYDPCVVEINKSGKKPPRSFLKRVTYELQNVGLNLEKELLKHADRKNILNADYVLTNSNFTRECVFNAYGVSAQVCYPGVDSGTFKPLNIAKKNYIITVGGVETLKQHDFVIRSLAKIPASKRPAMIIVGPWSVDTYVDQIIQLAKTLNVHLTIKRLVTDDELLHIYNEAKLVVYPPLMEPFGLVPLEAMACRTPVIGVKEGGIKETILDGKTGYLIERNEDECARTILKILDNQETAQKMSTQARDYVCQEWTWKTRTDKLEELLQSFIKGKP